MDDPLDLLIADGVIDEVLGRLKSGKEANISLVRRGGEVLAAKVYKDRTTRSFKNNAEYKEGRKVRNTRTQRAMESGGRFGRNAAEQEWKSAEADALHKLIDRGVRVPTPVVFYEGVLIMSVARDAEGRPAPRLIDVAIEPEAAIGIYADLCAQMISMLCCDLIHGDLSPYNILASADGLTIIDFPQVVSAVHSSRAEFYFLRDFDNVVRFVSGIDPSLAVHVADGRAIWRAYVSRELTPEFVPPPPPPPRPTRGPDRRGRPDDRGPSRGPQRRDGRGPQGPGDQRARGAPNPNDRRGPSPSNFRGGAPSSSNPNNRRGPPPSSQHPNDRRGPAPPGQPSGRGPSPPQHRGPSPSSNDRGFSPPAPRSGPPPARPGWTEERPRSSAPPPSRGGRRRPKRRW